MNIIVHKLADVASDTIGDGTRIWQYVVVLPGARIGANCSICSQVFIENDVVIGDRVTIKCGVQLWDGMRVGNDVVQMPLLQTICSLGAKSSRISIWRLH
jgi:UDP-3-O-[3-hydroxymyristoyl] glucosamine N-acyltransferase